MFSSIKMDSFFCPNEIYSITIRVHSPLACDLDNRKKSKIKIKTNFRRVNL